MDLPVEPGAWACAFWRCEDAVAPVDADQLGDAPQRVVLELVQLAVGEDDLPHQADELDARLRVEMPLQHAGEGVEVDRVLVRLAACRHQPVQRFAAEVVGFGEDFLHPLPFRVLAHAVGIHDVVHQRRSGDARIVRAARPAPARLAGRQFLQKSDYPIEHIRSSLIRCHSQKRRNRRSDLSCSCAGSTPGSSGSRAGSA